MCFLFGGWKKAREMIFQIKYACCLEKPSLRHIGKTLGKQIFVCKLKVVLSLSHQCVKFKSPHAEDHEPKLKIILFSTLYSDKSLMAMFSSLEIFALSTVCKKMMIMQGHLVTYYLPQKSSVFLLSQFTIKICKYILLNI